MKKKLFAVLTCIVLAIAMAAPTFADGILYSEKDYTVITREENGKTVIEGDRILHETLTRGSVIEYVGIDANHADYGPWKHGVSYPSVISLYTNIKYPHGSSVRGVTLVRSPIVPKSVESSAVGQALAVDGANHAYWRVEP